MVRFYVTHMMDKHLYAAARSASKGLFKNALVLPVAIAISSVVKDRGTFEISDLREELGGRAADDPIRKAIERITSAGAVKQLASLGPPHSDVWERRPHPLWTFAREWMDELNPEPQPEETT